MPRIYVETSVISYLANRPSRNGLVAARQALTHDWWATLDKSLLCVSDMVLEEISQGNPEAARNRLRQAQDLLLVEQTPEAFALATRLLESGVVPRTEPEDAMHIALATVHGCQFLASWIFAHFVGFDARYGLLAKLQAWGHKTAYLVTPEELFFGRTP